MKLTKSLIYALIFTLVGSQSLFAALPVVPAGLLSNTTLNGAITATQTTLVLGSASASTGSTFGAPSAGQCLLVDKELMRIVSMNSTTATVQRGTTYRSPHATSAVILTGACNAFRNADPPSQLGNQDCTLYILPWVNVTTGDFWWCELVAGQVSAGTWSVTNPIRVNGTAGSQRLGQ